MHSQVEGSAIGSQGTSKRQKRLNGGLSDSSESYWSKDSGMLQELEILTADGIFDDPALETMLQFGPTVSHVSSRAASQNIHLQPHDMLHKNQRSNHREIILEHLLISADIVGSFH